jgi:hypothetical protein
METGGIGRPSLASSTGFSVIRSDAASTGGAVRTDLPPAASPQAIAETEPVRLEPRDRARERAAERENALRDVITRNLTVDPRTREIVFQAINERTGEVVRQTPDEAILRLRAYAREMKDAEASDPSRRVEKLA